MSAAASSRQQGSVLVVSGPSGAGKSSVCRRVLAGDERLRFSVSCTTRAPRAGEVDGRDYHFLEVGEFRRRVEAGHFLEYAEVHGNLYGTLVSEVEGHLRQGVDVLLDIDVQGARQIREAAARQPWARAVVFVFIGPPSYAELERRLRGRGTESEEAVRRRLAMAREELRHWREYDYSIVNDELEAAVADFDALVAAERLRTYRWIEGCPWSD